MTPPDAPDTFSTSITGAQAQNLAGDPPPTHRAGPMHLSAPPGLDPNKLHPQDSQRTGSNSDHQSPTNAPPGESDSQSPPSFGQESESDDPGSNGGVHLGDAGTDPATAIDLSPSPLEAEHSSSDPDRDTTSSSDLDPVTAAQISATLSGHFDPSIESDHAAIGEFETGSSDVAILTDGSAAFDGSHGVETDQGQAPELAPTSYTDTNAEAAYDPAHALDASGAQSDGQSEVQSDYAGDTSNPGTLLDSQTATIEAASTMGTTQSSGFDGTVLLSSEF